MLQYHQRSLSISICVQTCEKVAFDKSNKEYITIILKRVTPITMKPSILPGGLLKTKLIINYNNHDKWPMYK